MTTAWLVLGTIAAITWLAIGIRERIGENERAIKTLLKRIDRLERREERRERERIDAAVEANR